MANEKMMALKDLAVELDGASVGLGAGVQVLDDVESKFMQLVDDMNIETNSPGWEQRFDEWHRELRILSQLMHHTMSSVKEERQNIRYISEGMSEECAENEK